MTNENRINELQKLLSTLAQLNDSGYRCNTEIEAVMNELQTAISGYEPVRYVDPDIAHTLRFFYGITPSEAALMHPRDVANYLRYALDLTEEAVQSKGTPRSIDVEQQYYRAESKARDAE